MDLLATCADLLGVELPVDIGERQNVYDAHPEIVDEMQAFLTRYIENGRSTPGTPQTPVGGISWAQLWWMLAQRPL